MEPPATAVGPVRPRYFDKRWITIAADVGAGRFAIDLNPAKGGVIGHIVWMHHEASIVRVVTRPASVELEGRFHKPDSLEKIRRLEKRMKTTFPKQLVCSLTTMGRASGIWLQPGKFESRPISIGIAPEVVVWDRMFRDDLENGSVIAHGLVLPRERLNFVQFANAWGLSERLVFYVVCSPQPHPLAGKVLQLSNDRSGKENLTIFASDIASFLEQGLALMQ